MNDDADLIHRCGAKLPDMGHGMFFSHATAAAVHGLPLPRAAARHLGLHISSLPPKRAMRGAGVIGHQLRIPLSAVVRVTELPVAAPVETWVELAGTLSEHELVVVGDGLLRRKAPLATWSALRGAVDAAGTRPGAARLRAAMPLIRARTDSPMESVVRLAIRRAGLPEPLVNPEIPVRGGRSLHGDLVFPKHRVVVEYDGDHHRTDDRQYHRDIDRLWKLEREGWRVVRINKTHIAQGCAEAIKRTGQALAMAT